MISLPAFRQFASPLTWLSLISVTFPAPALAVLSAICAAPASPEILDAWRSISPLPYPLVQFAQVLLQAGRGGYKSTELFISACHWLFGFDPVPFIAQGSEVISLIVAPTKKQAAQIVRNGLPLAKALAELLGGSIAERSLADGAELVFRIPGADFVPILRVAAPDEATLRGGAYVFCGWSEAGWFPSGPRSVNALADLRVAVVPRGIGQFPFFLELLESTNGPPAGYFYETATDPPANVLKIGPLASNRLNPSIDVEKLRRELSPEEFSQEILCETWGLKHSAFIPATQALAAVDEDGKWTNGTVTRCLGARVAFDHGGSDEIATARGRAVDVKVGEGNYVKHLVVDFAHYWRPTKTPPTREQVALPGKVSASSGGVPIMCDGRSFVDVADELEPSGFRAPDASDDDERKKLLARGGKVVIQMPMQPAPQTKRFTKLRELVMGGRLHIVDNDPGREMARQLCSLRATQLASKYLRIEAESGAEDGLADCVSYLAEALDSMPATREGGGSKRQVFGPVIFDHETRKITSKEEWRLIGPNGEDLGRTDPDASDPSFAQTFATRYAAGEMTPECFEFMKMRLGTESPSRDQVHGLLLELVDEGKLPEQFPTIAILETEMGIEDFALAHARRW